MRFLVMITALLAALQLLVGAILTAQQQSNQLNRLSKFGAKVGELVHGKCNVALFERMKKPIGLDVFLKKFKGCLTNYDLDDIRVNDIREIYQLSQSVLMKHRSCLSKFGQCFGGGGHERDEPLKVYYDGTITGGFTGGDVLAFRYQVLSKLGAGGFADVALVYDYKIRSNVALKAARINSQDLAHNGFNLDKLWKQANDQIEREIEVHGLLNSVDSFGKKYLNPPRDALKWGGIQMVVFDRLKSYESALEFANFSYLLRWAYQILLALKHMNLAGLVHNDIKPENILFRWSRIHGYEAVINDLALSQPTGGYSIAGTLEFASPYRLQTGQVTANEDMYSFGLTLINFVLNRLEFQDQHSFAIRNVERFEQGYKAIYNLISPPRLGRSMMRYVDDMYPQIFIQNVQDRKQLAHLISWCLVVDPQARITIDQALEHPLFHQLDKQSL
ncbi:hypothetical protein MIR68_000605 [Amoeboaphelidium protococcarum]|nr:hypothetical protein MIR68_000605 [Amoeboaphelidium protococcarum]